MRPSSWITSTRSPGVKFNPSLTSLGMTTWNLGETVTALISIAELLHESLIDARLRCQGEATVTSLRIALLNGFGEGK